jgi:hypothetical protein
LRPPFGESFSTSGNASSGKGADFVQEEQNRDLYKNSFFMPPKGVTDEMWKKYHKKYQQSFA